jgi:hypothetical protein
MGFRRMDQVFVVFAGAILIIILLFGAATAWTVANGDKGLALRMLNILATMFSAFVGFGGGYILGSARARNGDDNGHGVSPPKPKPKPKPRPRTKV